MSPSRPRLRIVGGALRGRSLRVAAGSRPTESRVRSALFSIWGERLAGCRFLDLFAGSGGVGLEAISRGAAYGCFVESSPRALAALRRNCEELAPGKARILRRRLPAVLGTAAGGPFDLIFADPPYDFDRYRELLASSVDLLAPEGEVVVEHSSRRRVTPSDDLERIDERRYGETCLDFFSPAGDAQTGACGAAD